jgi:argininosuccinate lyase
MHLSRLGSEIVFWSSTEFGFCQLDESFSSGSSIMPQKVNPDSAELLRAKSPRVAASYATLLGVMHALPLTYGKDMQEDKEPLFDAIDQGKSLSELTPEELRARSAHLDDAYYEVLERSSWLESKRIAGGTGSAPLAAQIEAARDTLAAVQARVRTANE